VFRDQGSLTVLCRNVAQRLGCGKNGAKDINNHSWFLGSCVCCGFSLRVPYVGSSSPDFDWNLLVKKKMKAFWTPSLSGPLDASHFPLTEDDHDPMPYADDGSNWDAEF
jgi:hypothetical protein